MVSTPHKHTHTHWKYFLIWYVETPC